MPVHRHRFLASGVDVCTAPYGAPQSEAGRDGSRARWFENGLHHIGGWNPNWVNYNSYSWVTCKEHYVYTLNPFTKTKLADAPWDAPCHTFILDQLGDKLYKYGSDGSNVVVNGSITGNADKALWSYKGSEGWLKVLDDFGAGTLKGIFGGTHTDSNGVQWLYKIAGEGLSNANVYRWKPGMLAAEKVADLSVGMQDLHQGQMYSRNGEIILVGGGGTMDGNGHYPINNKVFVSPNGSDGVDWSVRAEGEHIGSYWCDGHITPSGIMFNRKGADGIGGLHRQIIYSTDGGYIWKTIRYGGEEMHASAVCCMGETFIWGCGYASFPPFFYQTIDISKLS